jgi:hypothetical protein
LQVARSWSLIWGRVVIGRPFLCLACLYLCFSRVCVLWGVWRVFFLVLCIVFSSLNEMTCSSPALFDKKKLFNICSVLVLLHYLHVLIPFGLFLVLMFHLQA